MILRALTLAAGIAGAALTSQAPAFSQQYLQRLGGAVDALGQVVADFDASAAAEGLSRTEALAQMRGTDFLERRRADMERSFARFEKLQAQQAQMALAGPFMRSYHAARLDGEVARAALAEFEPALPLNLVGAVFAAVGAVLGVLAAGLTAAVLRALAAFGLRKVA